MGSSSRTSGSVSPALRATPFHTGCKLDLRLGWQRHTFDR
jgi:hypothetical protein